MAGGGRGQCWEVGRGTREEFKLGAKCPGVSSKNSIEKVWESCFFTPEYRSGGDPGRRVILRDKWPVKPRTVSGHISG